MALKSAVWTALSVGGNMERICFLFQNHQKEPDNPSVATQAHCSCSLLVSSTSQSVSNIIRGFIPLFHLHHYCFCFFSNPISHTSNLSQKQTLAHTHICAILITDTHKHPEGHVHSTNPCSRTHSHMPSMHVRLRLELQQPPDVPSAGQHITIPANYDSNLAMFCQYR